MIYMERKKVPRERMSRRSGTPGSTMIRKAVCTISVPSIMTRISEGLFPEEPVHDSVNWYAYCGGNPITFWDPSGKSHIVDQYLPLTEIERQIIATAEVEYTTATDAEGRQATTGKAWTVRYKYLNDLLPLAIETLKYEGVIIGSSGIY